MELQKFVKKRAFFRKGFLRRFLPQCNFKPKLIFFKKIERMFAIHAEAMLQINGAGEAFNYDLKYLGKFFLWSCSNFRGPWGAHLWFISNFTLFWRWNFAYDLQQGSVEMMGNRQSGPKNFLRIVLIKWKHFILILVSIKHSNLNRVNLKYFPQKKVNFEHDTRFSL